MQAMLQSEKKILTLIKTLIEAKKKIVIFSASGGSLKTLRKGL